LGVLGLEESLVAISHECDTPRSVLHLPHATGSRIPAGLTQAEINAMVAESIANGEPLYTVNAALIRELAPDLVVTQGICDVCAVTPDTIETSLRGISCTLPASTRIISLSGMSIQGIFDDLQTLAEATDAHARAVSAIQAAQADLASLPSPSSVKRVALLEWIDPAYSPGHWVPEQIEAAGFQSVLGGPGDHSRAMHWSEVKDAAPDAIGVICCGFGLEENAGFAESAMVDENALGWFDGPIVAVDANRFFSRPTLAVAEGAKRLHQAFAEGHDAGDGFRRINPSG
jgi:iron complex transport system substrate-binding protein